MKKRFRVIAFLLIILFLLSIISCQKISDVDSTKPDVINIGYSLKPINVPTIVALEKEIFEEKFAQEGVEIKWHELQGPATTEALAAKSIDIAVSLNYVSALITKANGNDIKVISNYSKFPKGIGLVVRTDNQINSVQDLKEKKIALQTGTMLHEMLIKLLEDNNLNINDVEIVSMPSSDAANAIMQGQVDAAIIPEPLLTKTISTGKVKLLQDAEGLILGQSFIAARTEFLEQYPEIAREFLQVHQEALDWSYRNKDDALALASQTIQMDQEIVNRLYPKFDFTLEITENDIELLKESADFLVSSNLIENDINTETLINDLIDTSFLQQK